MTYQNRVDPWSQLHAHPSRAATRMGNRGILHDSSRRLCTAATQPVRRSGDSDAALRGHGLPRGFPARCPSQR